MKELLYLKDEQLKSLIEKQPIDELFKTFKPEYGSVTEFEI